MVSTKQRSEKYYSLSFVLLLLFFSLISANSHAQTDVNFVLCGSSNYRVCVDGERQPVCIKIVIPAGHVPIKEFELQWDKNDASTKVIIPANSIPDPLTFTYNLKDFVNSCSDEKEISIKLVTRNQSNSEENLTRDLTFINKPRLSFAPSRTLICTNQQLFLSNQSCPSTGNTYEWMLGDGTSTKDINTSKVFSTTGTYTVTLSGTNVCGAGAPATRTIVVTKPAEPKIGPDSGGRVIPIGLDSVLICYNAGGVIRLDGYGSISATAYEWEISPAVEYLEKTTPNSPNPKVRFIKPGTYIIKLRVNNACNVWSTQVKCTHIVEDLPVLKLDNPGSQCVDFRYRPSPFDKTARYTINGRPLPASGDTLLKLTGTNYTVVVEGTLNNLCGANPQSVTFTMGTPQAAQILSPRRDTVLCAGTADLPLITNLTDGAWDASPYIVQRSGKSFFMPKDTGTYTLHYRRGVGKCERDTTVRIKVGGIAVKVNDMAVCRDQSVLKLTGSPGGGQWRSLTNCPGCIRNDTLFVGRLPAGSSSLQVEYQVSGQCSATATAMVTIGNPVASFSIIAGCSTKPPVVINSSTGATFFQWRINGQPVSTDKQPTLTLPSGRVQVTLVAWSGSCTATTSQELTIAPVPSDVKITPSVSSGCSPLTVTFNTAGTAQDGVSYQWNFGNGTTSTTFQSGQRVFENTGRQPKSYTITFGGSTACGSFSQTASVTVRPRTKAEIGVDSTTVRCPPAVVRFSSRYTSATDTVLWNFGDQSAPLSTTASVVDHEFKAPADKTVYFVRLDIRGECGTDSDTIPVTVLPVSTTALFTISRSRICVGEPVTFTDATTPKPARVSWDINGEKLDGSVVVYTKFTKPNTTYRINQTVYPECGGYKTYEQSIQTDSVPTGAFRLPMEACPGQPVSVTNLSSSTHRFRWNFGDGLPIDSTYFSPTHTYPKGGTTYTVTMTVVSFPVGCTASVPQTISIRNKAEPRFSLVGNKVVCSDTLVSFRDSSTAATQWKWYANGVLFSTAQNPQIRLNQGQYDIKLWTSNNGTCPDSVELQDVIRVDTCTLQVADIFTPDGNNIGDNFTIYGSNLVRIQLLRVFSRSGGQVYEGVNLEPNNQTVGWDGKHQNQPLPPDNYVYEAIVELTGGITKRQRGVITLLR
jgi:gliding motility-associated-like protein